jgi:adenine-specific DNA-methyltransferase
MTLIPSPSPSQGEGGNPSPRGERLGEGGIMRSEKYHRTSPEIKQRARELRKSSTPAEQKLWQALRNRNLGDYKFRRQHPLGPFIADFFCAEVGLVIELDGGGHLEQREYDQDRTDWLEGQGFHVIRFWNDDS